MSKPRLRDVSIDELRDPHAPIRSPENMGDLEELARSIGQLGVIEPIIVAARDGGYEVVAGHRRFCAAKMAGLTSVPCVVHDSFKAAEEAVMLHENVHREDLNPVDEARLFRRLAERVDGDTERLAELVRARRDYVEQRLRLLDGDGDVLAALDGNHISIGVAEELNLYDHPPTRRAHLQLAVQGGASVSLVRSWRKDANRQHALQQTRSEEPAPVPEPTPAPAGPQAITCYFCGSADHVEMMEPVYIHKPCKGLLHNALGERFRQ